LRTLGWSRQRPERRARECDERAIRRRVRLSLNSEVEVRFIEIH
jgi:hypothetical protein